MSDKMKIVCLKSVILRDYENISLDVSHTAFKKHPYKIYEVTTNNYWTREFYREKNVARFVQYLGRKKPGESLTKQEFKILLNPELAKESKKIEKSNIEQSKINDLKTGEK